MLNNLLVFLADESDTSWFDNASQPLQIAIVIVGILIFIAAIVSFVASIFLAISYIKYNHTKASCGLAGKDVARKILDDNGLNDIAVKASGSFIFGNSYSHYFKKVRLRRLTWKKDSISSLAMAGQKASLAILDKEGDKDMRLKVALTPFIYFGPLMCVPLIVIGAVIDYLFFNFSGTVTIVATVLGLLLYVASFIMSIMVLKTEIKAQQKALVVLKDDKLASDQELAMMTKLFKLYNIQYVIDMIVALLELIMRILQILANLQGNSNSSTSSD